MIGDMCNEINFDIHFCRDEETHFACELATMQDFESVHPDSSVIFMKTLDSIGISKTAGIGHSLRF